MKYIFLFFGNYGSGKTFLSRKISTDTIALASPIRSIAFQLLCDPKVHSLNQEEKESSLEIPKTFKKPKGISQMFFDNFLCCVDDFPKTYRGFLQAVGKAGRDISPNFWVNRAKDTIKDILITRDIVCVDDLRYVNEFNQLKKLDATVVPIFVYDGEELVGYELDKLLKKADITIDNYRKKNMLKVSKGLITIETPINNLREVLIFLNSQES